MWIEEQVTGLDKRIEIAEIADDFVPALPVTKYPDMKIYDKRVVASLIEKVEVIREDTL